MQRRYGKMHEDNVFRGFHALKTSAYSPFAIREYKEAADPSSDVLLHRIAAQGGSYREPTADSKRRAISSGDMPGGKATGALTRTVTSPKWARRRCLRFICQTPSSRMGTTGMRRFSVSRPMPLWNGAMRPSSELLTSPSGKTNTLWPRSTDSPAKRKLSRKPESCGSGKTLKSRVASQ